MRLACFLAQSAQLAPELATNDRRAKAITRTHVGSVPHERFREETVAPHCMRSNHSKRVIAIAAASRKVAGGRAGSLHDKSSPALSSQSNQRTATNEMATENTSTGRVVVNRDGQRWRVEIPALGVVCQARSLGALDHHVRQLLATAAVDYHFHTGDTELDSLVVQIRAARLALRQHEARVRQLTGRALTLPSGASLRDLAVLLGLSYQRIHQLMRRHDRQQSAAEGQ